MKPTVKTTLRTRYETELDRKNPYPEYPRPQFKRDSFYSLNGEWDFEISSAENIPDNLSGKILVPFPPESRLSGVEMTPDENEYLYYRRFFTLPQEFTGKRVILNFGAVDQLCTVFVNGKEVGHHEGGYIPFSFDITSLICDGENELSLKVTDRLDLAYPYGKQTKKRGGMWYTPVSGIWQTVWLEAVPKNRIDAIKITPSLDSVKIEVSANNDKKILTLCESGEMFEFCGNEIVITPKEVHLWTPETPYLYRFTLECGEDKIESYFALRTISVEEVNGVSRLCLNGKPYLFNGLLDQGYYPDGIFLPGTINGFKDDILAVKAMGFNMLRKHIKVEPAIFYYLCDSLGMIVFQDMVNNSQFCFFRDGVLPTIGVKSRSDTYLHRDERSRRIFEQHARDTIAHLYNCPCIVYYTIFNEGWGQFCADQMYKKLKPLDESRIFDSTSGWFKRTLTDVESDHIYFKKIKVKPHKSKPSVISEFGGYAYRVDGHFFGEGSYGYTSYDTAEKFAQAIEKLYSGEVADAVKKCVSALVYTQVSDVEDEINGFLTYDREVVKIAPERMMNINRALFSAFEKSTKTD